MKNLKIVLCAAFVATGSLHAQGWGESFATVAKEFPVVVPALALGGIVATERFVPTQNRVTTNLAAKLTKQPAATLLVGLLAGHLLLKNLFPKLMKQLIVAPVKKNPILTAGLCAVFFAAPWLRTMVSNKEPKTPKTN